MKNIILFLLITTSAQAQLTNITGKVTDKTSGAVLPFVNVFIANSTKGTSSDETGKFTIANLPIGTYTIVASMVGYLPISAEVIIKKGDSSIEVAFALQVNQQLLDEITVKSKKDKDWKNNLKKFQRIFFGTNINAQKCKITNPYVIDFQTKGEILMAKSSVPILVENLALGYKITIILKEFEASKTNFKIVGDTFFEEILASSNEKNIFQQNRLDAYRGSLSHFLRSLARRTSLEEGFKLYAFMPDLNAQNYENQDMFQVKKSASKIPVDSLIKVDGSMTRLNLSRKLEIHYYRENDFGSAKGEGFREVSSLESEQKSVRFNQFGIFENPFDVFTEGAFSTHRIADLLPIDFQPKIEDLIAKPEDIDTQNNYARLQENIVFHTNKSNYVAGETLWFKTYLTYTHPSYQDAMSRVVYVDLINSEQKIIETKILRTKNGVAHGDFMLNPTLPYGTFYLRGYTNWMRNFGDSTQTVYEFLILNKSQTIKFQSADYQDINTIFSLNEANFKASENVEIELNAVPNQSYSISVTNENAVKNYQPIRQKEFNKKPIYLETLPFLTETGRTFFGQILNASIKPISADLVVIRKDTFLLDTYESDKNGDFKIENILGKDSLVIDIMANDKKGKPIKNITLNEPDKPIFYKPKSENSFQLIENQQIETVNETNYYYDFDISKSIMLKEVAVKAKRPDTTMLMRMHKFIGKPSFTFTDAKVNFNAGFNFIQALQGKVPGLDIKFDALTGVQSAVWSRGRAPEIWIDGVQAKSMTDAGFLSPDMIARIDVHRQNRSVVAPTGIIAIYTKAFMAGSDLSFSNTPPADGIKRFKMQGFYTPRSFYVPDIQAIEEKLNQLKSRSTIYWNPEVITDNEGNTKVSFRAVGKPGKYRIQVVGFDEYGKIVKHEKTFNLD
jgi:CarboxypepD_reg-like domain/TonB-dependent Receptor Plug Domain